MAQTTSTGAAFYNFAAGTYTQTATPPDGTPGTYAEIASDGQFSNGEGVDPDYTLNTYTYIGEMVDGFGTQFLLFLHSDSVTYILEVIGTPFGSVTFPASFVEGPGVGQLDTANPFILCFGPGTAIATPSGEVAVETLTIGDLVLTSDGRTVPVKWIGRQRVRPYAPLAQKREPVRIAAGALGGGLPHSDLTVSADHGMFLDGMVINTSAMVNGTTVAFVPVDKLGDNFTYYHIETEGHEVILANGSASETFVDIPDRKAFDNYQEYLDLYGVERIVPEMKALRITSQRLLPEGLRVQLGLATQETDFGADRRIA